MVLCLSKKQEDRGGRLVGGVSNRQLMGRDDEATRQQDNEPSTKNVDTHHDGDLCLTSCWIVWDRTALKPMNDHCRNPNSQLLIRNSRKAPLQNLRERILIKLYSTHSLRNKLIELIEP